MNSYEIIKIDDSTWRIEDNGVRFFLLSGDMLRDMSRQLVKNYQNI